MSEPAFAEDPGQEYYLKSLGALISEGNDLRKSFQYQEAESIYLRALQLCQEKLIDWENHPGTAIILNNLADLYQSLGRYAESEDLYLQALAIKKEVFGRSHASTATSIQSLATLYLAKGDYKRSEEMYHQALQIRSEAVRDDQIETAATLSGLAVLYDLKGLHDQAHALHKEALGISKRVHGFIHALTATSLNNLGEHYRNTGQNEQAKKCHEEALAIRVEVLGQGHPDVATSLNNIGLICLHQGTYQKAEGLFLQAIEIKRGVIGGTHPDLATTYNNLAQVYHSQCQYSKALYYYQLALDIRQKVLGPNHPDTATSLGDIAGLYLVEGQYEKAESFQHQALAIRSQVFGLNHPECATTLANLSGIYLAKQNLTRAEALGVLALEIRKKVLRSNHPDIANSLNNLGQLYWSQGRYDEAALSLHESLKINTQSLDEDHPDIAVNLNNLANIYLIQQNFDEAESLLRRALGIFGISPGIHDANAAVIQTNLVWLYLLQGRYAKSLSMLHELENGQNRLLFSELPRLPASTRLRFLRLLESGREMAYRLALVYPEAIDTALSTRLQRQGFAQEIERLQNLLNTNDPFWKEQSICLQNVVTALASATLSQEDRNALQDERDRLERDIYSKMPVIEISDCTITDVAQALPASSALVEIELVESIDQYVAIALRSDASTELINLGSAERLNALIQRALAATTGGFADANERWREVSHLLLKPLLDRLNGIDNFFVSMDGLLHRVPVNALPLPGERDGWVTDRINIYLLSYGRDLVRLKKPVLNANRSLVLANPSFDRVQQTCADPADKSQREWQMQRRSRDIDSLGHWPPLPATSEEGRVLCLLLNADLLTEDKASALNLQKATQPMILHAATHGYFLADQEDSVCLYSLLSFEQAWPLVQFRGEDPMLRSGLVLAGANQPHSNPEDDGYLTALEATYLDLQGTELVTLSACETGCGDIQTGEGVYGLQRSLIVAGARSMLLSLWKVPDDATCEFMVRFYTLLKQGLGRRESLITVQREFRNHPNPIWRDLYFWGAWQLIGDWRPIQGL